jgi:hypothetical protein
MGSAASVLLRLREAAVSGAVLVASPPTERRFGGGGAASIACEGRVLCSRAACQKATLRDDARREGSLERSNGSSALLLPAKNDSSRFFRLLVSYSC